MNEPGVPSIPSDEVLMAQVARQDRDAFVTLVHRHQGRLVGFFRRMGDAPEAEDLAQETFVRLFKYRMQYTPTARFTTFLYLLAQRVRIDHWRKQEHRKRVQAEAAEREELAQQGTRAAAHARERVAAALAKLTDGMRSVVVMSVYQGLKYREIAAVLDIPEGTVKTRMFHALQRIKEAFIHDAE